MKWPEAELLPLNHGLDDMQHKLLMQRCKDKDVIMVDYSLRTRELNDRLNAVAKSFRILDHHKSAQEVLAGAPYATFDMKRSGAGLAWDYLFGKDAPELKVGFQGPELDALMDSHRPWWVNYTEDQDLWNWALPDSQEINAYLMTRPRTIEEWNQIVKMDRLDAQRLGIGIRTYIEYYTRSVIEEAQEGVLVFEGINHRTAVLNIPYAGEAGNALCKNDYSVSLLWFERGDGQIQFSLRSDGSVDVSKIAQSFGGGGHHNASGFELSLYEGRILVDRILGRSVLRSPGGCIK
jgi:oligoribonuclease NrnB/cAMP/cGMP phosphodiesterase (DHH superfamily)